MPGSKSSIHLKMFGERPEGSVYGLEWGDPDSDPQLKLVRDDLLAPLVDPTKTVLEIGPGGGRWTRYLLAAKKIYVVDPFPEILDEHRKNITADNIERIVNNGTDFPNVPDKSIDFVFSFGVFVHLDTDIISAYLEDLHRVLAGQAVIFIQFSDKTKLPAIKNRGFSLNTPKTMRRLVFDKGYSIIWENTSALNHSSIMLFRSKQNGEDLHETGAASPLLRFLYPIRA